MQYVHDCIATHVYIALAIYFALFVIQNSDGKHCSDSKHKVRELSPLEMNRLRRVVLYMHVLQSCYSLPVCESLL